MISNRKTRRRSNALLRKAKKQRNRQIALAVLSSTALTAGVPAAAQVVGVPGGPQCTVSGTTADCSGDLQAGIAVGAPIETLNVDNVDAPGITPADGRDGIRFDVNDGRSITINVDTSGTDGISTNGAIADAIEANRIGAGDGDITITSTGDLSTQGSGADGIEVNTNNSNTVNNISVSSVGNITTNGNNAVGIYSSNVGQGTTFIRSEGDITTDGVGAEGIDADSTLGTGTTIDVRGNITTQGNNAEGITAGQAGGNGDIVITSTGEVRTVGNESEGISVTNFDSRGNVSIVANIVSTQGDGAEGVLANSNPLTGGNNVSLTTNGLVSTEGMRSDGVAAGEFGTGSISITAEAGVTTLGDDAEGIIAVNQGGGSTTIISNGQINTAGAGAEGIEVIAEDTVSTDTVLVTSNDTITRWCLSLKILFDVFWRYWHPLGITTTRIL